MKTTEIAANFERNDVHMLIPTSYKNSYGINSRFLANKRTIRQMSTA